MRSLLTLLILLPAMATLAQDGKATTARTTFSRKTTVSIDMKTDPAVVWALLTNAHDYPKWNTTVISIEGNIAPGETIRLRSTLDSTRTFKLKVKESEPGKKLVWGDGQGTRVYTITAVGNGTVTFTITEQIGGVMFPMYAGMIPSFDRSFERFAADLKQAAEARMNHQ